MREVVNQVWLLTTKVAAGLLVFLAFWLASMVLDKTIRRIYDRTDLSKRYVVNLLGQTTKIGILGIGAVSALGTMGVNVAALVAGLGLTGFALGFALRDALSNLLAGVLILVYRPFQVNDRIAVAGFEGTVSEIDLRYTTLQAEGKKFLIPNSTLFTNPISLLEAEKEG